MIYGEAIGIFLYSMGIVLRERIRLCKCIDYKLGVGAFCSNYHSRGWAARFGVHVSALSLVIGTIGSSIRANTLTELASHWCRPSEHLKACSIGFH